MTAPRPVGKEAKCARTSAQVEDGGTAMSSISIGGGVVWMRTMTSISLSRFLLVVRLRVRGTNMRITTARMDGRVGDVDWGRGT